MRVILLLLFLSACAGPLKHTLKEDYGKSAPAVVTVLPARGEGDARIKEMFRSMATEKLSAMNYSIVQPSAADADMGTAASAEFARSVGADAVLSTEIKQWKETILLPYGSLKAQVEFLLFSNRGELLWSASYAMKDSSIRMDRDTLAMEVAKVYEPRIQRMVDSAFLTLPRRAIKEEKFFEWLE